MTHSDEEWIKLFKQLILNNDIANIGRELYTNVYFCDCDMPEEKQMIRNKWTKRILDLIPNTTIRDEIKDYIYNDLVNPIQGYVPRWGQEFPHEWSEWIIHQL